ncbi:cleft lip and palate transmembrane protein 1 [Thermus thermophilus]|nr:cleft lip and palate transmembrane protein 1 [Thermus thermophilus]
MSPATPAPRTTTSASLTATATPLPSGAGPRPGASRGSEPEAFPLSPAKAPLGKPFKKGPGLGLGEEGGKVLRP